MFLKETRAGFALIELMIIVATLSVLLSLFLPHVLRSELRKKQEECHDNLRDLYLKQKEYFKKNGFYASTLNELHWSPQGKGYYQYRLFPDLVDAHNYIFECFGDIDKDPAIDRATIDSQEKLTQIVDDTRQ